MKGFYSCFSVGDISPPYRTDKHNSVCNAEIFGNVQNQLHLEGYGTLFSGIKKLVAGLSILLLSTTPYANTFERC